MGERNCVDMGCALYRWKFLVWANGVRLWVAGRVSRQRVGTDQRD